MGALNAAPNRDPFAFELQLALSHYNYACFTPPERRCNNESTLYRPKNALNMVIFSFQHSRVTAIGY